MAANAKQPPKGILKKSTPAQQAPGVDPKEIAVQHANILQHRKELEAEILESVITLSEYPIVRDPPHNAINPAPSDVADFRSHVRLFQPSDYDDLIEERNVNGLCGYTLCAKPHRQTGGGGEWKITGNGDIVKRKDLEKWCSQKCARRALYVKVQLNETAAWERAGIPDIEITLLEEGQTVESEADRAARKLGELKLEDQRQAVRDQAALALERGERDTGAGSKADKMNITLKEKDVKPPSTTIEPDGTEDNDKHLLVEGWKSKMKLDPEEQKK